MRWLALLLLLVPTPAAAQATFNACTSTTGIAVVAHGSSTTAPPLVAFSTGYYAGLFYNIADGGSDEINANHIGLVSQSVYGNAFYAQQGGAPGSPGDGLSRNNVYPAAYVTRVIGNLNGHDYTAPLLKIEDTTAATGDLAWIGWNGVPRFRLGKTAAMEITGASSVAAVLRGNTGPTSNAVQLRFKGRADGETFSIGTDLSTATGQRTFEIYNLMTGRSSLTIAADDTVNAWTYAASGLPGLTRVISLPGCTMTITGGLITGTTCP